MGKIKKTHRTESHGSVVFSDLVSGDRFTYGNGGLWTKINPEAARSHHPASIRLGERGYGYRGDTIASFSADDRVKFIAPSTSEVRQQS